MKKLVVVVTAVLICCQLSVAQQHSHPVHGMMSISAETVSVAKKEAPDAICGTYLVISPKNKEDKIKVRIFRTGKGSYSGRITWLQPSHNSDGTERTDLLNKDPKLRNRKATDITLCWNLTYDAEEDMWKGGSLYDPTTGKTFGIQLKMAKNGKDIDARYYKGLPAFGIDQKWTNCNTK